MPPHVSNLNHVLHAHPNSSVLPHSLLPVPWQMSDQPLKEMSDSNSSPLLSEPLSSRYKLYESELSSPTWPSSSQDTHPALPLLEMPEEKVSSDPTRMLPKWEAEAKVVKDLLSAETSLYVFEDQIFHFYRKKKRWLGFWQRNYISFVDKFRKYCHCNKTKFSNPWT